MLFRRFHPYILGIYILALSAVGYAQGETQPPAASPYEAAHANKPEAAATAGVSLSVGQSKVVGNYSPGVFYLFAVDPGYTSALGLWNRIDFGVDLGMGKMAFSHNDTSADSEGDIKYALILKAGFGYHMGPKVQGYLRGGVGPMGVSLRTKVPGIPEVNNTVDGLLIRLGWDMRYPVSDKLDALAGIGFAFVNLSGDKVSGFQVNMPHVNLGMRYLF